MTLSYVVLYCMYLSGRWVKPISKPLDESNCSLCGVLEDEYHFVFECSMYIELRKKYVPVYY